MKTESTLTSNRMETLSKYFSAGRLLATVFAGMLFLLVFGQPATAIDNDLQGVPQEVVLTGEEDKGNPPPPPDGGREMNIRVFLQGYYINDGDKKLRRARGVNGNGDIAPHFSLSTVSDRVTIRLHSGSDYSVVRQEVEVYLLTSGYTINFQIDDEIEEPVWVSVKHRNHLETVWHETIDLGNVLQGSLVEIDFTTEKLIDGEMRDPSFGENQHQFSNGEFGIYAGDVGQSGAVNIADRASVINALSNSVVGYVPEDIGGTGAVNIADRATVINALSNSVTAVVP